MVQYRPQDLPRLRDELVRFGRSDIAAKLFELDQMEGRIRPGRSHNLADLMRGAIHPQSELFYVTPEMCELAELAANSLPEFTIQADDAPGPTGLLWFSRVICDFEPEEDLRVDISAVSWRVLGQEVRMAMMVQRDLPIFDRETGWGPRDLVRLGFPPVFPLGHWDVPFEDDGRPMVIENDGRAGRRVLSVVKTIWLLMRQPLAGQEMLEPTRAQRRQAAREGREAPPVRVIRLRRPSNHSEGPSGSVNWHHQWMVRGHWRMQAWGRGRQLRRPVWISPFVKGPEGAPMLGGEKVYVLDQGPAVATPSAPPSGSE